MRKRRPVIILLCIQLAFITFLSAYNPIKNLVTRTFGTEYTFEVENLAYYGNFIDDMELHCQIKTEIPDYYDHALVNGKYGIIETDKNGLSRLSVTTDQKPEGNNYIKSKGDAIFYFTSPYMTLEYEIFELGETIDPPLFIRENLTTSSEYDIAAVAYIFKGRILLKEILVNGVEISEFLTNQKEVYR